MPANLTPQYHKAEAAYRTAQTSEEELECLQVMLREIPKHKGTDKLQADLKAKIAKLKLETAKKSSSSSRSPTKIPKQGAGRIVLLGAPNAGKSQLLASLTRAKPEIAPYPFTTQVPQIGMMTFEDCPFQLIDLPPVTADYFDASILGLVRGADLVFLVIDLASDTLIEDTQAVLNQFQSAKTRLGRETALSEQDIGTTFTHTVVVCNKIDADGSRDRLAMLDEFLPLEFDRFEVSATQGTGLKDLEREVFQRLDIVRVYSKNPKAKEADMSKPFTIHKGDTLVEVAEQIHRDLVSQFKTARVWGSGVHPGTTVKPDYQPQDRDIVELHTGSP